MIKKTQLKTPLTYYGGKQTMLPDILPLLPEHTLYCEPFAGGAAVYFAKERAKTNVINDLNQNLITFYKVLKNNPKKLKQLINDTLNSRDEYQHAWHVYKHPLRFTSVERAWAVWVLSKMSFAGQFSNSFAFDKQKGKRSQQIANAKLLLTDELISLLESSTIECDNALTIIKRFDFDAAFFFIDPPYINANMGHYSGMFNEQNLQELLEVCANMKGKFMLTMYPHKLIQSFVDRYGWKIQVVNRKVTASLNTRKDVSEWLIMNY